MDGQVPGLDADALSTELDAVAPTWTAGAPYFGELAAGPGVDPTVAADARKELTRYWERDRALNSWRTDSGRPHICVTSTRPSRTSRRTSSPAMPASSSSFSVPWTTSARRRVTELVGDDEVEVPVVVRVRLGVAGHDQRRGVDVAVLLDAQVELEVGPVRRERVENLLEFFGKRHDCGLERTWPDSIPYRPRRAARAARAPRRRRGGRRRPLGAGGGRPARPGDGRARARGHAAAGAPRRALTFRQ